MIKLRDAVNHGGALRPGNRRRAGRPLLCLAVLLVAACDGLLDVELPGSVPAGALDNPDLAELLVASVISDFECAFSNYVTGSGLLTDELQHSSGAAAIRLWDLRQVTEDLGAHNSGECGDLGFYLPLQTARFQSEDAVSRLEGWSDADVPDRTGKMATAAAFGAYATTLLGESMCEVAINVGPAITPTATLEMAEERFTQAIQWAQASGNDVALNMSLVGRARVRLNLGRGPEAVADASLVPEGFIENATRGTESGRRENQIWERNHNDRSVVVDPLYRDVTWEGQPDSRVDVIDTGGGSSIPTVPLWVTLKHASAASPIRLASWVEAQLIIAEAEGGATAVAVIDDLHQRAGIPGFSSSDPAEIEAQVREERRREFYLEGHRLNDMLRFDIPFPSGVHPIEDQPYSTTTCLPLPLSETESNPNIGG